MVIRSEYFGKFNPRPEKKNPKKQKKNPKNKNTKDPHFRPYRPHRVQ